MPLALVLSLPLLASLFLLSAGSRARVSVCLVVSVVSVSSSSSVCLPAVPFLRLLLPSLPCSLFCCPLSPLSSVAAVLPSPCLAPLVGCRETGVALSAAPCSLRRGDGGHLPPPPPPPACRGSPTAPLSAGLVELSTPSQRPVGREVAALGAETGVCVTTSFPSCSWSRPFR